MELEQNALSKIIEVELISASALMEAEDLLDRESPDYFRGFLQGYAHCLKLSDCFDAINNRDELL
jgi:hypothetical protein